MSDEKKVFLVGVRGPDHETQVLEVHHALLWASVDTDDGIDRNFTLIRNMSTSELMRALGRMIHTVWTAEVKARGMPSSSPIPLSFVMGIITDVQEPAMEKELEVAKYEFE